MKINYYGAVYPTRYALPYLKQSHGQLVVNSSQAGIFGFHYRTLYCASKYAVIGFFEALRMEISDKVDITVLCTPSTDTSLRESALLL